MMGKKTKTMHVHSESTFLGPNNSFEDLPLEILETVLENVESRNELLSFRLVNSVWKSAATSVLRLRCKDIATRWDQSTDYEYGLSPKSFPTLTLVPSNSKHQGLSMAFYPRGSSPLQRGTNPLITNSLVLATSGSGTSDTFQNIAERQRVSIYQLLQLRGTCLTTLQIYGAKTNPEELYKLLQKVPNLKTLTLAKLRFDGEETVSPHAVSYPPVLESPVPQLTHAMFRVYSPTLCSWLVTMLAPQLVSLDFVYVSSAGIMPFDCTNYSDRTGSGLVPFGRLKQLKVVGPSKDFILNTGVHSKLPLESLIVEQLWAPVSNDELAQFIERFAGTLVNLRLNIGYEKTGRLDTDVTGYKTSVTFPRLLKFAISTVQLHDINYAKDHLLPRFTNLKTLRLGGFKNNLNDILVLIGKKKFSPLFWGFFERLEMWTLCPTLKTIELPKFSLPEGKTFYTFTRQERDERIARGESPFVKQNA